MVVLLGIIGPPVPLLPFIPVLPMFALFKAESELLFGVREASRSLEAS